MSPFVVRDGHLCTRSPGSRGQSLLELARSTDGPFYAYVVSDILERARRLRQAFSPSSVSIHYAQKANGHHEILRSLAREGIGADTVSAGEIEDALACGFAPDKIVFSGVGKTVRELELAVRLGIKQINVESIPELERLAMITKRLNRFADIAVRINPDVNPKTHPYITTGFRDNKFGLDESALPELRRVLRHDGDRIRLRGLTLHIGSQLMELSCLSEAIIKTLPLLLELRTEGHPADRFDIGGGLGINYDSDDTTAEFALITEYGEMVKRLLSGVDVELMCEPGRILVARAGVLIGQVQYVKKTAHKTFLILDTGMHHLLRPALYQARHRVLPLVSRPERPTKVYDVVGPICESSDVLARSVRLPEVEAGDYLAMADAGAYGFSMASVYNRHRLPAEVLID